MAITRGLVGVQPAISDAHPGLKGDDRAGPRRAPAALHRPPCVTCGGHARRHQHDLLGALIRSIFTAPRRPTGALAAG
jgi:hypothetical protein